MENRCPTCGRPYGQRKRCYFCTGKKKTGEVVKCAICGKKIYVQKNQLQRGEGKTCSWECRNEYVSNKLSKELEKTAKWVGNHGYVVWGKRLEHRVVMEQYLGRSLESHEQVHHRNGVRTDNRLENLELVSSRNHHVHHPQPKKRVQLVCNWCGKEYEKKKSRASESKYCCNECRLKALHEGNKK